MKAIISMIAMFIPSIGFAGALFPQNPVPMHEGYGSDGAGTHFADPQGIPGPDCVINPVSLKRYETIETKTVDVPVTKLVKGDVVSVPAVVLFDFDKDTLRDSGKDVLTAIAQRMMSNGVKVTKVTVIGHTDAKGTDQYNLDLGQRRANTVALFLNSVTDSIDFVSETRGESEPVAPNTNNDGSDNPQGRQQNRRVDLRVDDVMFTVNDVEHKQITEVVEKDRNPQIFHVLAAGNNVLCDGQLFGGPQYFWWSGR